MRGLRLQLVYRVPLQLTLMIMYVACIMLLTHRFDGFDQYLSDIIHKFIFGDMSTLPCVNQIFKTYSVILAYILPFQLHYIFPKVYTCTKYRITRIQESTDHSDSNSKLLFSQLGCITQIVLLIVNRKPLNCVLVMH